MSLTERLPRMKRRQDADLAPALERLRFKSLDNKDGKITLAIVEEQDDDTSARIIEGMAVAMIKHLGDAENYVETVIRAPRVSSDRFVFRVERAAGSSPHALRAEAEARVERLEWIQRQVSAHVTILSNLPEMQKAMGIEGDAAAKMVDQVLKGIQSLLDGSDCGHCSTAEQVDSQAT